MSSRATHVLVLFGGVSGEHSISIRSAATVVPALSRAGFRVTSVGITRDGDWRLADFAPLLARAGAALVTVDANVGRPVALARGQRRHARLLPLDSDRALDSVDPFDVVFPVLHGPNGEDGRVQGHLDVVGVPYVGAGPAASAMAMDKLCMKTLCAGVGIPQTDFLAVGRETIDELATRIERSFGFPCFVKPANLGSSVGISRVPTRDRLAAAIAEARRWDERVLVERAVDAREIEIAILGSEVPRLSPIGEIVAGSGFYDFDTKYVADDARLIVPAELPTGAAETIREIASRVWELIGCRGMARADFFIDRRSGQVLFNEINTIPGFTSISMYPRLWGEAGVGIETLVETLVQLGLGQPDSGPGGA
jgi:D-alanine-D-alanine ligase